MNSIKLFLEFFLITSKTCRLETLPLLRKIQLQFEQYIILSYLIIRVLFVFGWWSFFSILIHFWDDIKILKKRQKRYKTCRIFHQIFKSASELPMRILQWKICCREVVYFISLLCCQLALTKGSDKSKLANPLAYKNPHCIKDLTNLRTYELIIKRTEKKFFMLVFWKTLKA